MYCLLCLYFLYRYACCFVIILLTWLSHVLHAMFNYIYYSTRHLFSFRWDVLMWISGRFFVAIVCIINSFYMLLSLVSLIIFIYCIQMYNIYIDMIDIMIGNMVLKRKKKKHYYTVSFHAHV